MDSFIFIITLLSLFCITNCAFVRSYTKMSANVKDVGLKGFFKKIGGTVTRICYDFNQGAALVANFPILFIHRCAEFKDIVRAGINIAPVDGEHWSYKDSVDKAEVVRILDHVQYGRMVQSVYHLLNSDFDSGLYGQSVFGNETPAFIEKVFAGYKVVDILATTLDTPNQLNTFTGTALSETISRQRGLHYISKKGNFMGFVAYNEEKKDLAIIFRGTILDREWIQNINGLGSAWNDSELQTQSVDGENGGYGRDQISLALLEVKNSIGASLCINLAAAFGLVLFFSTFYHSASEFLATDKIVSGDLIYSILKGYVDNFSRFFSWIPSGDLLQQDTNVLQKLLSLFGGINFDKLLPLFDIAKYFIQNASLSALVVSIVNSIVSGTVANLLLWGLFSRLLILFSAFSEKEKVFQTGFSELYTTDPDDGEYTRSPQKVVYDALYKYLVNPSTKKEVKTITTSGHSLGASLAVIAAHHAGVTVKALSQDFNEFPSIPVRCITFACPKVASSEVFKSFPQLNIQHYHYLNRGDIVPMAMTGIFTNGLGFDNNHVLRLDPANLDRPYEPTSPSLLASVPRGVWGLGDAAALLLFLKYTVGETIAEGFRSSLGFPDPESRGVMKDSKLKKIAWPIGNLLGGIASKSSYFRLLSLLGFQDETSLFLDAMGDWHNNEHLMYNILVEVYRADPSFDKSGVRPELSLINYDGDRISRNIDAVRSHPFVGPKFVPIRAKWFNAYRTEGQRLVVINRASEDSVLAEKLFPQNIENFASEYRTIFLHNLEKFKSVATTK